VTALFQALTGSSGLAGLLGGGDAPYGDSPVFSRSALIAR
jgi:hypothetical protein